MGVYSTVYNQGSMKSQYIKIRNVPDEVRRNAASIRVKPWWLLFICLVIGIALLIWKPYMFGIALPMVILTVFALTVMPDRILVQFGSQYMLMYNRSDRSECTMIYYDEIVSWHYEYHRSCDQVIVELVDGSSESVEMYSRMRIRNMMNLYAPGKEMKRSSGRRKA
ncbi:MAG: hypothetical protein LKG62_09170 [Solobacterium sp.]|nr:hypothetical protein [Solobacterium sp.]